ncbi:MAG TPA: GH92 family glycosyl hydrolase [bacterium]|nr:GH92 family glycosyl hydrolase [bacterium]
MRLTVKLALIGSCLAATVVWAGPSRFVDPFIGTAGGGNTFPGALVPWGMVSVSPHNDSTAPSGYRHGSKTLFGFGHVHLSGTGCADLGNVLVMPTAGELHVPPDKAGSEYDSEEAAPGYYRVNLRTYGITAEMTATTRAGFSQYSFPLRKGDANILIDAGARLTGDPVTVKTQFENKVKILSSEEVEGQSQSGDFCSPYAGNKQTVYFVARFSKPALAVGTWRGSVLGSDKEQTGRDVGAYFRFNTAEGESIGVKVGISYVSVENARMNLAAEIPGWDFEEIKSAARKSWDEELSKIEVYGATADRLKVFYTALYHALIHPSVFSDVNGQYQGFGRSGVKKMEKYSYTRYHVFSLWDTYRCLHPFLGLCYPDRQLDMVRSLEEMAAESGWLPRWELAGNDTGVMVGDPAAPVILDTYRQGLKDFDAKSAYDAVRKSLQPGSNRTFGGLKSLLQYGYIPKNDDSGDNLWGSVSTSLEYSYDYWCLAQLAKDLKDDGQYETSIHMSGVYRNLYDSSTGFLRAKNRDGSWMSPFDPTATCCDQSWPGNGGPGYVEGNAWQYLFFVPHDVDGLKMLLGGDEEFVNRLRECFEKGYYDPGNEPDIAYPYLYDYVPHEGWRTEKQVRALMEKAYGTGPDGLPGNDDGGALSAWYLFSALGFYPVCPGSGQYQIGSPLFKEVNIHLNQKIYPSGLLSIKTINNSSKNIYVQSIQVKGLDYKKSYFDHDTLVYGDSIVLKMGSQPRR